MKKLRYLFLSLWVIGGLGCSTSTDPNKNEPTIKSDGTITINIAAQGSARGKKVYLKLYDQQTNIFDPDSSQLTIADTLFNLTNEGVGSATFSYNAKAGETYQILGVIDTYGNVFINPDRGDYYFTQTTQPIDGDLEINLNHDDLSTYETILGAPFVEKKIGDHHVSIWEADNRNGTESLGWMGDGDNMTFKFDGTNGAIGRIGKRYDFIRVDDVPENYTINVDARLNFAGDGKFYFTVYGWTYNNTDWNNSDIKHEFYVIQDYNRQETDPFVETITIEGEEFDMHRHEFGGGSYRFKAIRKTGLKKSGPVNLKPFFEYWRTQGMANDFLEEVTWGIELLYGSHRNGTLYLWNIDIPSLTR